MTVAYFNGPAGKIAAVVADLAIVEARLEARELKNRAHLRHPNRL